MSDDLVFSDELPAPAVQKGLLPWQVLVVDDEPAVHEVTKLVMAGFEMDGRPLHFTHCYSAAEARAMLGTPNDFALILLDVVMESEHAGLDLARHIREDIKNLNVRIVLRTGQPGQAPEEQVIKDYDINDYKEKTDLTRRRLITVFYAALRAYRDLMRIEHARLGLRRSIEAISQIYDSRSLRSFASAVLEQVNMLLNLNGEGLCASRMASCTAYTANAANGHIRVLAATDAYAGLMEGEELESLPTEVRAAMNRVLREHTSHYGDKHYAGYFKTNAGSESMIYMVFPEPVNSQARELLEIFSQNVAITYDGLLQREDTHSAQRDTISMLGGAIEKRSSEASLHIQRVGNVAALLASLHGAKEDDVELIRMAASLHDVGKAAIADYILTKPGPLTAQEWEQMKSHSHEGAKLLGQSKARVHILGAKIAQDHHERWDGTGYPQGLIGEAISLEGRITAIADVLDALLSDSCYKKAWPLPDAIHYLSEQSGKHFDPRLIALLQDHLPELKAYYD
jgi:response regulator RpfG family c-di-GMP phosphodiesterase